MFMEIQLVFQSQKEILAEEGFFWKQGEMEKVINKVLLVWFLLIMCLFTAATDSIEYFMCNLFRDSFC